MSAKPAKPPPDHRILKIRDYEDKLARMNHNAKVESQSKAVAIWENVTNEKIKQLQVKKRFEALKARREADIEVRRRKLADKLYQEDQAMKQELINSQETPEQRRAKLAARARELASRREGERQALAQQLYDRAFAENCDVLRDTNSKRLLYRTLDERNAQIEQKMASKILEEEERRMFDEMLKQEALRAEQRHLDDKRRQREGMAETVRALDEQVRVKEQRRQEEQFRRQQEILETKAMWEKMAAEEEAAQAADREKMRKLAAELMEFKVLKQMEMTELERQEKELDLRILQEALAKEVAEEEDEAERRYERLLEAQRYRQHLMALMAQGKTDDAERDAFIDADYLEQQARRDAELAEREAARRKLMAEVDAIRQQQIADKGRDRLQKMEDARLERLRIDEEASNISRATSDAKTAAKKKALEHHFDVQAQMVAKNHIKAAEMEEKVHQLEEAARNEEMFMTKVKQTLQASEPQKWYGRRKFEW